VEDWVGVIIKTPLPLEGNVINLRTKSPHFCKVGQGGFLITP